MRLSKNERLFLQGDRKMNIEIIPVRDLRFVLVGSGYFFDAWLKLKGEEK
jgi:hypothetical protein